MHEKKMFLKILYCDFYKTFKLRNVKLKKIVISQTLILSPAFPMIILNRNKNLKGCSRKNSSKIAISMILF